MIHSADWLTHTLCMYICICICILTKCNSNQPFDSVSLSCILLPCYIRDGATCIEYHTRHPRPQKYCRAVSGNISMHLIFKLQANATGACLLSLVKHQPQQSLPTDMSQMSIGGSKPYCNKPYCNEPYCSKPVPWAVLCCITDHILLCWHHTIQCSRLSSIIRHKGATVIDDSRAQMCDIYTGCFTHPSAAWAALQSRWLFW